MPAPTLHEPQSAPDAGMSRRSFLRTSAVLASGMAALAASLSPLRELGDHVSLEQFVQKYYKELTPEEMAQVLKRIEREVERQYGIRPHVQDLKPMDGVEFVYALNLTRCIGCRTVRWTSRKPSTITLRSRFRKRASSTCRCNASSARTRHA